LKYAEQEYAQASVKDLRPHPKNPRQGDVGAIHESIEANGFYGAIVAQKDTGYILAGNHRYKAAVQSGAKQVPVIWLDVDEATATRVLLADNRTNDRASYDNAALAEILAELAAGPGLEGTGYDGDDLDTLIADLGGEPQKKLSGDLDQVPDDAPARCKPGDLWLLGEHRLLCGDSTKPEDLTRLMGGVVADLVFTDPPYGVNYQSIRRVKSAKFARIENDDRVMTEWASLALSSSRGFVFVWTSWKVLGDWLAAIPELGAPTNMIVWDKGGGGIGDLEKTFSTDFEIALVWNRGNALTGKRIGSVWGVGKDRATDYKHPTQKPVGLAVMAMESVTVPGDVVLDVFLGSGSTLIACEQLGRKCCGMEISPQYCDVILKRWEDATGGQAVLEPNA
jgi:DNA modification methylase